MQRKLAKPGSMSIPVNPEESPQVESVTVHYGEELFAPVQYHSFRVGGHSITVKPRAGESVDGAIRRAQQMLEELVDREFDVRLANFRTRLKQTRE
jgi:hypothetical protein